MLKKPWWALSLRSTYFHKNLEFSHDFPLLSYLFPVYMYPQCRTNRFYTWLTTLCLAVAVIILWCQIELKSFIIFISMMNDNPKFPDMPIPHPTPPHHHHHHHHHQQPTPPTPDPIFPLRQACLHSSPDWICPAFRSHLCNWVSPTNAAVQSSLQFPTASPGLHNNRWRFQSW